jgi:hypothetical protein
MTESTFTSKLAPKAKDLTGLLSSRLYSTQDTQIREALTTLAVSARQMFESSVFTTNLIV